ncbi:MAG TPA: NAD(P)-dependent alcohol dehydrogenase [Candidatus Obscuribacterales bacterium]
MPVKTTTRAFVLSAFDKIEEREQKIPALGAHDVLVEMKAASLNYRDVLVCKGLYSRNLNLPLVVLSDGAGSVVETGAAVTRVKKGDRVMPAFFQTWISGEPHADKFKGALGAGIDGVLRNEAVFNEDGLLLVPDHLSFEEAATLPCAALTAWNALFEYGDVQPGTSVLTLGTGGVSIFALQLAKAAGARVVISSSSDEKLKRAKELGADVTINYKQTPEWDKAVLGDFPQGVDHVIEVGGSGTLDRSVKSAKAGGHISLIGVLAAKEGGQFDPTRLLMKGARLQGIFVGSREMFERMNRALVANRLRPVIDRTFKAEQISEALEYMASGSHFGKIVVKL